MPNSLPEPDLFTTHPDLVALDKRDGGKFAWITDHLADEIAAGRDPIEFITRITKVLNESRRDGAQ